MAERLEARQLKTLASEAWQWLGRELDSWAEADKTAQFWWRDDDATEPSGALDKLAGFSSSWNIPLALAVIPTRLAPELIDFLHDRSLVVILQHGYAHENHAPPGQRKLELGGQDVQALYNHRSCNNRPQINFDQQPFGRKQHLLPVLQTHARCAHRRRSAQG